MRVRLRDIVESTVNMSAQTAAAGTPAAGGAGGAETPEQRRARLQANIDKEKAGATPEQLRKAEAHAAVLSRETGRKIEPWSVEHLDATNESIKRNTEEKKKYETELAATRQESESAGSADIVPGSQAWGQLSPAQRRAIKQRYAEGKGPSISVRYNPQTGKFDQPGYASGTGQYGDIVTALNQVEDGAGQGGQGAGQGGQGAGQGAGQGGQGAGRGAGQGAGQGGPGEGRRWSSNEWERGEQAHQNVKDIQAKLDSSAQARADETQRRADMMSGKKGTNIWGEQGAGAVSAAERAMRAKGIDPATATPEQWRAHAGAYKEEKAKEKTERLGAGKRIYDKNKANLQELPQEVRDRFEKGEHTEDDISAMTKIRRKQAEAQSERDEEERIAKRTRELDRREKWLVQKKRRLQQDRDIEAAQRCRDHPEQCQDEKGSSSTGSSTGGGFGAGVGDTSSKQKPATDSKQEPATDSKQEPASAPEQQPNWPSTPAETALLSSQSAYSGKQRSYAAPKAGKKQQTAPQEEQEALAETIRFKPGALSVLLEVAQPIIGSQLKKNGGDTGWDYAKDYENHIRSKMMPIGMGPLGPDLGHFGIPSGSVTSTLGSLAVTPPEELMAATSGRIGALGFTNRGIANRVNYYKNIIGIGNPVRWGSDLLNTTYGIANRTVGNLPYVGGMRGLGRMFGLGALGRAARIANQWADAVENEPAKLMAAALYDPRVLAKVD